MLESTMRLDRAESTALAHALAGVPGQAFLFGSRVNDAARVGDIEFPAKTPTAWHNASPPPSLPSARRNWTLW